MNLTPEQIEEGSRLIEMRGGVDKKWYATCHTYINRKYGKAYFCENTNCKTVKAKRYEWALIKGKTYSKNKDDYMQLCKSCHTNYDMTEEHRSNMSKSSPKIRPYTTGENHFKAKKVIQIKPDGEEVLWPSINRCAVETGLIKQSILKCLYSEMFHTKGNKFKWYNQNKK